MEASGKKSVIDETLHRKRKMVLKELVMTEEKYVNHMSEVVSQYMEPLEKDLEEERSGRKRGHILKQIYIGAMFSVIKQIYRLNSQLLADLQNIDPEDRSFSVGKVMKPVVPFFKLYKVYCSNHNKAMTIIERCSSTKPKFTKFCQSVLSDPEKSNQPLQSLLIMPIQRLPRFKMLLDRLLKYTPADHRDHESLKMCLSSVSQVADYVNQGITEKENRIKVWEVQQTLVPPPSDLIAPHRVFVREGVLEKVCRRTNKARYFFLFNDLIIYGERLMGKRLVAHRRSVYLRRVVDIPQMGGRAFAVYGSPKSFILLAKDIESKALWFADLKRCCQTRASRKSAGGSEDTSSFGADEAPLWVPDNFSETCMVCDRAFTVTLRRHHCRKCGILVCGNCSRNKVFVPQVSRIHPVRICDPCKRRKDRRETAKRAKRESERRVVAASSPRPIQQQQNNSVSPTNRSGLFVKYLASSAASLGSVGSSFNTMTGHMSTLDYDTDSDDGTEGGDSSSVSSAASTPMGMQRRSGTRTTVGSFKNSSLFGSWMKKKKMSTRLGRKRSTGTPVSVSSSPGRRSAPLAISPSVIRSGDLEKTGNRFKGFSKRSCRLTNAFFVYESSKKNVLPIHIPLREITSVSSKPSNPRKFDLFLKIGSASSRRLHGAPSLTFRAHSESVARCWVRDLNVAIRSEHAQVKERTLLGRRIQTFRGVARSKRYRTLQQDRIDRLARLVGRKEREDSLYRASSPTKIVVSMYDADGQSLGRKIFDTFDESANAQFASYDSLEDVFRARAGDDADENEENEAGYEFESSPVDRSEAMAQIEGLFVRVLSPKKMSGISSALPTPPPFISSKVRRASLNAAKRRMSTGMDLMTSPSALRSDGRISDVVSRVTRRLSQQMNLNADVKSVEPPLNDISEILEATKDEGGSAESDSDVSTISPPPSPRHDSSSDGNESDFATFDTPLPPEYDDDNEDRLSSFETSSSAGTSGTFEPKTLSDVLKPKTLADLKVVHSRSLQHRGKDNVLYMPGVTMDRDAVRVPLTPPPRTPDEYAGPLETYAKLGIKSCYLPTTDHFEPSFDDLCAGVHFMANARKQGAVYVHCKGGHGRSAAVVAAWLLSKYGGSMTPGAAQKHLNYVACVRRKLLQQPNLTRFYQTYGGKEIDLPLSRTRPQNGSSVGTLSKPLSASESMPLLTTTRGD
eukprot:g879.t1